VGGTWEPFGSTRQHSEGVAEPAAAGSPMPGSVPAPALPVPPREPARQVAVITCMDARIDPLAVLGLRLGDANVLRNAGATVSDDVLRSLRAAASLLGVRRAVLIGHTDCAGHKSDAATAAAVGDGARRIRAAMGEGFGVEAHMYDVAARTLTPVV
jgi:Carbonic anhydrase